MSRTHLEIFLFGLFAIAASLWGCARRSAIEGDTLPPEERAEAPVNPDDDPAEQESSAPANIENDPLPDSAVARLGTVKDVMGKPTSTRIQALAQSLPN